MTLDQEDKSLIRHLQKIGVITEDEGLKDGDEL